MLPNDSDSLPKDVFAWLWLHKKAYGLIIMDIGFNNSGIFSS